METPNNSSKFLIFAFFASFEESVPLQATTRITTTITASKRVSRVLLLLLLSPKRFSSTHQQ